MNLFLIFSLLLPSGLLWAKTKYTPILVAIVDTGADLDHSLIQPYLWSNPGETGLDSQGREKSSNGIDDDANGFIDDVHGWNFIDQNKNLEDQHGHGTHVAGIIASHFVSPNPLRLMILKYYDKKSQASQTLRASNQALDYALKMGARIVNYSGGGDSPNTFERQLFQQAFLKKVLVIAASGNDGRSTDQKGFFPASYGFPNILSVASLDERGKILNSSNRGVQSVDLGALGDQVISSLPHQKYGQLTGTSQATAQVTAVTASIMGYNPKLLIDEVKSRLFQTAQYNPQIQGLVKHPRTPDVRRATQMRAQNELNHKWKVTMEKVDEVMDDPLIESHKIQRKISSSSMTKVPSQ